jgi:hypothetical protein
MERKERRLTTPEEEGIELDPAAWDRFPEFVKGIAKAGPQHRTPKAKTELKPKDRKRERVRL